MSQESKFNCDACDNEEHDQCGLSGTICRCYRNAPVWHGDISNRLKKARGETVEQPAPIVHNESPFIQDMVIEDMRARKEHGIREYGTALHAHNGRSMIKDAYDEVLDLAVYVRGLMEELKDQKNLLPIVDKTTSTVEMRALIHKCNFIGWATISSDGEKAWCSSCQHYADLAEWDQLYA